MNDRSNKKRQTIIDEITPSFQPTFVANDRRCKSKRVRVSVCSSLLSNPENHHLQSHTPNLLDWRNKSALQRYADDLEMRKFNLQVKMREREERLDKSRGRPFKVNEKSDDYLIRHFFSQFTNQCQAMYFPNLLEPDFKSNQSVIKYHP